MFNITSIKNRIHKYINRNLGTILIYHSVIDLPLKFNMWTHISASLFEEHMSLIAKEANVISLEEMVNGIKKGKLPQNAVAVTFDDGFRNNYTRAYPILQKYKIPATFFLSTGYIGSKTLFWPEKLAYILMNTNSKYIINSDIGEYDITDTGMMKESYRKICATIKQYDNTIIESIIQSLKEQLEVEYVLDDPLYEEWLPLSWNEVNQMEGEGLVSFGGHTDTHAILSVHSDDEIHRQIGNCKLSMENNLKVNNLYWAHPNGHIGDFSDKHELMLEENGFHAIFTSIESYVNHKTPLKRIARFGIGSGVTLEELQDMIFKRYHLDQNSGIAKVRCLANGLFGK